MGTLTIRKLDDHLKTRLRVRAADRGHSMEEEARQILRSALTRKDAREPQSGRELAEAIHQAFGGLGPIEVPDLRNDPILIQPRFGKRRK
jgi:plasmid stability protein